MAGEIDVFERPCAGKEFGNAAELHERAVGHGLLALQLERFQNKWTPPIRFGSEANKTWSGGFENQNRLAPGWSRKTCGGAGKGPAPPFRGRLAHVSFAL